MSAPAPLGALAAGASSAASAAPGGETSSGPKSSVFNLDRECELRIEVESTETIHVRLMSGMAEVFGAELAAQKRYSLCGVNFAVFSWQGATVEVTGVCHAYVARETPMAVVLALHASFDQRRQLAALTPAPPATTTTTTTAAAAAATASITPRGPRVIIVGPSDSGKSSLSKLLLNYAVRRGYVPLFADVDVGQTAVTVPGAVAAVAVQRPVDVEFGFQHTVPLVYFFGHTSPGENVKLYKKAVSALAAEINRRMAKHKILSDSGLIVNTCGWIDGVGYELVLHCIAAFEADTVLVLDNDRLYSDLQSHHVAAQPLRQIMKLAKSGGVVSRQRQHRRNARNARIREYFYGANNELSPHATIVDFRDVTVVRIGPQALLPSSALPAGATSLTDELTPVAMTPAIEISHSILAVSYATSLEQLLDANVAGFVCVQQVDFEKQRLHLLAPCPGALPGKFLVLSSRDIKWLE